MTSTINSPHWRHRFLLGGLCDRCPTRVLTNLMEALARRFDADVGQPVATHSITHANAVQGPTFWG